MADPRRYYIDPTLNIVENKAELEVCASDSGDWIKYADFLDYKNGQRSNASENTVSKLGLEIVALRTRLQDMEKSGNRLARAVKRLAKTDYDDSEGVAMLLKEWESANNG